MHSSSLFLLLSATAALVAGKKTTTIDQAEASCSAALDNYVDGIPSAPTKLLDAVATNTNFRMPEPTGDMCNIAWPTEVQSDIREYGSSVLSWYSAHEKSISTLFIECPEATAYDYVSSCADRWATYGVPNSNSASATATDTKSTSKHASKTKGTTTPTSSSAEASSTGSSITTPASSGNPSTFTTATPTSSSSASGAATSSVQGGGAAKETGVRLAAMAVAGLVAAAAAAL